MCFLVFFVFFVPYASFKIHFLPLNNPYMPTLWSLCRAVLCSSIGANPERRQNEGRTNPEGKRVSLKSLDRFLLVKLISLSKNVFYKAKNRVPPLRKMNVETDYGNCKLGHIVVIIVILSSCH